VQHGDKYHLHETLLTSSQEELTQQHYLQLPYGGMGLHGSCMTYLTGHQEDSSQQQKNWNSRKRLWQLQLLRKILLKDFPSFSDSPESFLTAEDSFTTADKPRLTEKLLY
jgi:hypothetical protein